MEMYDKLFPVISALADALRQGSDVLEKSPTIMHLLADVRIMVRLYGRQDEIDAFETLVAALDAQDGQRQLDAINNLEIFRKHLRNELNCP